jgi:hypothetical protein
MRSKLAALAILAASLVGFSASSSKENFINHDYRPKGKRWRTGSSAAKRLVEDARIRRLNEMNNRK